MVDQLGNFIGNFNNQIEEITKPRYSPAADSSAANNGERNFSAYNITKLSYPDNLHDENSEFNGNKVVFFINVAADSKKINVGAQTYGSTGDLIWDIPDGDKVRSSGQSVAKGIKAAGDTVGIDIKVGQMKRLSTAIALYMPNSIAQGTSVGWSDEDLDITGLVTTIETMSKLKNGDVTGAASTVGGAVAQKVLKDSSAYQRATRLTPGNSKQEMLFKGVDYRQMSFNYTFAPKSESEAKRVMDIIRTFKYHMLPEFKSESEFLYIYPSEFQIKYYKGSEENAFIDKQLTAVLRRVNVDYTPNGQFVSFANGMPTQINLSLEFMEIGTGSKEIASFEGKMGI